MGKDKLRRFAENLTFECFVQPAFEEAFRRDHPLKGHWHSDFFHNDRPIVLELGCGKGEYTVALAERDPNRNFIGIDIKGARMWRGAKTATERQMRNVGFLRTRIEMIASFFAEGEVDEIWITFPDPQLKSRRAKKRLTSPLFLGQRNHVFFKIGFVSQKGIDLNGTASKIYSICFFYQHKSAPLSHHSPFFEAGVTAIPDNDMVKKTDSQ